MQSTYSLPGDGSKSLEGGYEAVYMAWRDISRGEGSRNFDDSERKSQMKTDEVNSK